MRALLLLLLPCASHAKQDPWASRVLAPAPASAADAPTLHLPIVNVGLPKSGSSSVEDYFLCGGNGTLNVSHWNCATMLSASKASSAPWARPGRIPSVCALVRLNVSARNGL